MLNEIMLSINPLYAILKNVLTDIKTLKFSQEKKTLLSFLVRVLLSCTCTTRSQNVKF